MPKMMTRREFMAKGLTIVAADATAPMFLTRTALALNNPWDQSRTASPASLSDGPVLVVLQMGGGNDGLNTVVPYAHDEYYRARPHLAVPRQNLIRLTDEIGLHPGLKPFKALYDDGRLAVIQGVGYPNPNRSHFRSMEIWHTADPAGPGPRTGWLGRLFDSECPSCGPTAGIAMLGAEMPLALQGTAGRAVVLESPEAVGFHALQGAGLEEAEAFRQLMQPVPGEEPTVDFLAHTAMDATLASDEIKRMIGHLSDAGAYPRDPFSAKLRLVSELIAAGAPTRVYYVGLGGFDTHAAQAGRHDRLLEQMAAGLEAFVKDLAQKGLLDRVLVITFSEFGRRVAENASAGTDHGAAAPMFLIGGSVTPGIHGAHPNLTDLDQGDLKFQVDFRGVYATVLEHWMGVGSESILGDRFTALDVVRPRTAPPKAG